MPDSHEAHPVVAVEPTTGANATEIDDLIRRHQGLVRAACVRQSPPAQIDDCVQAVFLVLARKSKQATKAPSIEAWLLGVARLVCSAARRDDARRRRAEQEAAVLTQDSRSATTNPALEYLDACLAGLPERQRAVLCQHFLAGHSRDEVARNLGIGIDAVHQHCHRGLQRLRELLKRRGVAMPGTALVALLAGQAEAATTTTSGSTIASINTMTTSATQTAANYANGACMTITLKTLVPFGLAAASLLATGALGWMVTASEPVAPAVVPAKTVQNDGKPVVAPEQEGATLAKKLDQEITVDLEDRDLAEIIELFRKVSGINLVRDAQVNANALPKITIKGKMKMRDILAWVEKQTKLDHRIEKDRYILVPATGEARR